MERGTPSEKEGIGEISEKKGPRGKEALRQGAL